MVRGCTRRIIECDLLMRWRSNMGTINRSVQMTLSDRIGKAIVGCRGLEGMIVGVAVL